jgi:Vacuolar sorting protein 39 domain 1
LFRATSALIRYLADMRFKLARWLSSYDSVDVENAKSEDHSLFSPPTVGLVPDIDTVSKSELEEAAELVDTTLFRAYMLCRPQLVGPLVRRPNRCIPDVVQKMLEQTHVTPLPTKLMTEISRFSRISVRKRPPSTGIKTFTNVGTERRW